MVGGAFGHGSSNACKFTAEAAKNTGPVIKGAVDLGTKMVMGSAGVVTTSAIGK